MRLREDLMINTALLRRFHQEAELDAGDGRFYAIMLRDNGDLLVHAPGSPDCSPAQMLWAGDVLRMLNRELHHDGAWVVVFTRPRPARQAHALLDVHKCEYGKYGLMWLDADGDVQFTVEWQEGENADFREFADVIMAGLHSTVQKCEASWQMWKLMMRDVLDPQEGQLIKRAMGQAPSEARH